MSPGACWPRSCSGSGLRHPLPAAVRRASVRHPPSDLSESPEEQGAVEGTASLGGLRSVPGCWTFVGTLARPESPSRHQTAVRDRLFTWRQTHRPVILCHVQRDTRGPRILVDVGVDRGLGRIIWKKRGQACNSSRCQPAQGSGSTRLPLQLVALGRMPGSLSSAAPLHRRTCHQSGDTSLRTPKLSRTHFSRSRRGVELTQQSLVHWAGGLCPTLQCSPAPACPRGFALSA